MLWRKKRMRNNQQQQAANNINDEELTRHQVLWQQARCHQRSAETSSWVQRRIYETSHCRDNGACQRPTNAWHGYGSLKLCKYSTVHSGGVLANYGMRVAIGGNVLDKQLALNQSNDLGAWKRNKSLVNYTEGSRMIHLGRHFGSVCTKGIAKLTQAIRVIFRISTPKNSLLQKILNY